MSAMIFAKSAFFLNPSDRFHLDCLAGFTVRHIVSAKSAMMRRAAFVAPDLRRLPGIGTIGRYTIVERIHLKTTHSFKSLHWSQDSGAFCPHDWLLRGYRRHS